MTRKFAGVASVASVSTVVASLGLAATAVSGSASADPGPGDLPAPASAPQLKDDYRPDALTLKQSAQRQDAVDALVAGKAHLKGKGPDRTIQMANGEQVEYPATQTEQQTPAEQSMTPADQAAPATQSTDPQSQTQSEAQSQQAQPQSSDQWQNQQSPSSQQPLPSEPTSAGEPAPRADRN